MSRKVILSLQKSAMFHLIYFPNIPSFVFSPFSSSLSLSFYLFISLFLKKYSFQPISISIADNIVFFRRFLYGGEYNSGRDTFYDTIWLFCTWEPLVSMTNGSWWTTRYTATLHQDWIQSLCTFKTSPWRHLSSFKVLTYSTGKQAAFLLEIEKCTLLEKPCMKHFEYWKMLFS